MPLSRWWKINKQYSSGQNWVTVVFITSVIPVGYNCLLCLLGIDTYYGRLPPPDSRQLLRHVIKNGRECEARGVNQRGNEPRGDGRKTRVASVGNRAGTATVTRSTPQHLSCFYREKYWWHKVMGITLNAATSGGKNGRSFPTSHFKVEKNKWNAIFECLHECLNI